MTSWCAKRPRSTLAVLIGVAAQRLVTWGALLLLFWVMFAGRPPSSVGHVPVPDSVLNPQSAPEAWNVLRLSIANIERLIHEDRLVEVPDQASFCSPALRLLARLAERTPRQKEVAIETLRASSAVGSLAQACVAGDHVGADTALGKLHAALATLAEGTDGKIVNAEIYFCPMHPDVTSADEKALCPKCGMPLAPRRIPYSFVYTVPPGEPSMRLAAKCDVPPMAGQSTHVKVRLTWRDGSPINPGDLLITHTQRIHLLIIDSTLTDYHHEHPTPTGVPGEYEFTFTPASNGFYKVYADVVPAVTGIQEYVPTDLAGTASTLTPDPPDADSAATTTATVNGFTFQVTLDRSVPVLRAGQISTLRVAVRDNHGEPFTRLEPVMNAFAHLVGFYLDHHTVVHLHPAGPGITDASLRGGPDLEFRFCPPKEGLLRLFCQMSIDGNAIFVPFTVRIGP